MLDPFGQPFAGAELSSAIHYPVLLIEDDPAFAHLLQEWLHESQHNSSASAALPQLHLTQVTTLQEAVNQISAQSFAAVVVDLNLPDSQGMDTYIRLQKTASFLPIVVLSGLEDESLALQTMRLGAQDYLIKAQITGPLLQRAVRYAVERFSLRQELLDVQESERRAQERIFLDRIVKRSNVSSALLGVPPIKQSLPDLFSKFSDRFADTLEQAIEQRTHKVNYDLSAVLADIARELSFLKCGPRDVVEIYLEALNRLSGKHNPAREQAYSEEGRLLTLQLMGLLVSQYRPYALRIGKPPSREPSPEKR
ncbi:response regulator [Candidatus Magnetaquicoccus inordinatus]|uniref:response regulator n=1 Tax=Candidatus Magnetaquicoccus inordinatus TaxID=2496818 RepID=UPI00187D43AA|nr:response regulator [Candidatus Magnetaquicoccus inordinatus]